MSTQFTCVACGNQKFASPRSAGRQSYCGAPPCQRARKGAWQKQKIASDRDYGENQRRCYESWHCKHQDYWRHYRLANPDQVKRNRILQMQRNRRQRHEKNLVGSEAIAKMDALNPQKLLVLPDFGEYWMVPLIAKMDALKVKISVISYA